jgi:hypothetical protein
LMQTQSVQNSAKSSFAATGLSKLTLHRVLTHGLHRRDKTQRRFDSAHATPKSTLISLRITHVVDDSIAM